MKKFFITLMCIVMVVCFMPTVALAGGTDLASIIDNAKTGDTVTLSSDVTVNKSISIKDKNITIDLAGKTITTTVPEVFDISDQANVTITGNGQIKGPEGEEAANFDGKAVIGISGENAKLTVLNGTITAGGVYDCGMYGIYVRDGGTVELGDSSGGPTISTWCAAVGENFTTGPANIIINGGIYTEKLSPPAEGTWWSYFCAPIYAASSGTITINGGTFNGYYGLSSRYEDATQKLTINGGTFNGTKSALLVDTQKGAGEGTTKREISITGGTFSSKVTAYVPEGTKVVDNGNGTFTLAPADGAVAQVGDAGFTSLQAAIAAAADGDTVKLLDDVTLTETQNVAKNITIDFDTHSITGNDVRVFNVQNGTLTLTGVGTITSLSNSKLNYASSVIRVGNNSGESATASLVIGKDVVISAPHTYGVTVFGSRTTETVTVYGKVQCSSTHVGDAAAISGVGSEGYGGTTINIEPGAVVSSENDVAIYHPQAGVLNIKGGTILGKGGIEAKAGTIKVTGTPTITATDETKRYKYNGNGTSTSGYAIAVVENSGYAGGTQVNISGGTYTGAVDVVEDNGVAVDKKGSISITGGTFSSDPTAYVPANSNYRVRTNSNGTYTVYHYTPYVPSIPTDSLRTARTEAIKAVTDYVNPADYEEAQQAEIKTIVDNAKKNIEAAKTADEIKAIEAAAKAELDKLETAEEMSLIRAIGETKFVARSKAVTLKNGKKAIKITWYDKNGKEVKFDGVEIFRSTKRYSGYGKEPIYVSKSGVYYNTAIEAGTKYYYKVRGYVLVNGEKVYTDYSTKAWRTA